MLDGRGREHVRLGALLQALAQLARWSVRHGQYDARLRPVSRAEFSHRFAQAAGGQHRDRGLSRRFGPDRHRTRQAKRRCGKFFSHCFSL